MADHLSEAPVENISLCTIHGRYGKPTAGYDFFLVLNGEMEVLENGNRYYFGREDVLMASPHNSYDITAHGNNLILIVSIKPVFFHKGQSERAGTFICNSAVQKDMDFGIVRRYLCQLAAVWFEDKDIQYMHLNALAYGFLYYLNMYHYRRTVLGSGDGSDRHQERLDRIVGIVESQYAQPLTLGALAKDMYLTVPYLSRFIKQHLGENFNVYLNRVRLDHAVERLGCSTDSIIRIAHDTGFSSMNTFNRVFREQYKMTPHEYRRGLGTGKQDQCTCSTESPGSSPNSIEVAANENEISPDGPILPLSQVLMHDYDEFRQQIQELAGSGQEQPDAMVYPQMHTYTVSAAVTGKTVASLWNSMVNLGFAETILNPEFQGQLAKARQDIGFRYGRARCVLSDDMIPYIQEEDAYNFVKFDRIITFLQSVGIVPMLELNYKGAYMIIGKNTVFSGVHDDENFSNTSIYLRKINALLQHCVDYYGESEIEQWIFEIGYYEEKSVMAEAPESFVRRMQKAAEIIKAWVPQARVGGICHKVWAPIENLADIVDTMDRMGYRPDFISLSIIPYEPNYESAEPMGNCRFSPDSSYALSKVKKVRRLLAAHRDMTEDIYVTTLCVDMISRNALNDSCYQASFLTKTMMDLVSEVQMLGYWEFSDVDTEYVDTASLLHGGSGLVSKFGIPKPGYFALQQMAETGNRLLYDKDGCMVLAGRKNCYMAVIGNYIRPGDLYCMQARRDVPFEDIYSVFENSATKDVCLMLMDLLPGNYHITMTTLNRRHGSLLDAWMESGLGRRLRKSEIEYLRTIVHTQSQFRTVACEDGKIKLNMQLMPHEVKFIAVRREILQ